MPRKLVTVEEVYTIYHRGVILFPGVVPEGDERLRIGDPLRLVRPDGSELQVVIDGIDMFNCEANCGYALMLALPKTEVPLGSEVWSM